MLENLLDEAFIATSIHNQQKADQLTRQLVSASDKAVAILVASLRQPGKARQAFAIHVLHLIGYPQNEPAIPELIYHIGDPNLPGWREAMETLTDMGSDVVVPHLVQALLEKGPPYHTGRGNGQTWAYDVEGLCTMLSMPSIASEYALGCCSAIHYLLSRADFAQETERSPDIDGLLDVVEKAGAQVPYVLPTLIVLAKKHRESDAGKQARRLISVFPDEVLAAYKLLLHQL